MTELGRRHGDEREVEEKDRERERIKKKSWVVNEIVVAMKERGRMREV